MNLTTLSIVPEPVIRALGSTLIHSLWQGILLAAATGIIVIATKKSSAALRYNLLVASLLVFVICMAGTFGHQLSNEKVAEIVLGCEHGPARNAGLISTTSYMLPSEGMGHTDISDYLNGHADTIVLIWLLIVCARSLQMLCGLYGIFQLRHNAVSDVDSYWQIYVDTIARSIGIRQAVRIAESGLAKVPVVVGHLKPMILIPAGLLTALPPAEIEAVMVHELAHIRRRDYLVNLLQTLAEIVFFFNPAVLWISSLIRTERENCCDDMAVSKTASRVDYIRALVSCEEYRTTAPAFAMAANGGGLTKRVNRMLSQTNGSLNRRERSLLAVGLLTAGLLTAAFTGSEKIERVMTTLRTTVSVENIHTDLGYASSSFGFKAPKNMMVCDTTKKDIATLTIPPVPPVAPTPVHEPAGFPTAPPVNPEWPTLPKPPVATPLVPLVPPAPLKVNPAKLKAIADSINDSHHNSFKDDTENHSSHDPSDAADKEDLLQKQEQSERDRLTAELVKEGIIRSYSELYSFKLSDKDFVVNGRKVPDDIYLKFRSKYVKVKGNGSWSWMYNYETTTITR